jgi:uncharacterized repeat protein (TIGR04076 family)
MELIIVRTINVKPVEIAGNCRANLTVEDEFQIRGMQLENPRQSRLCLQALSHLPPIVTQLQRETHCFAHVICSDCLSRQGLENGVVFLLGHADKWELCQAISAYDRLCDEREEPQTTRQLKAEAIQHLDRDEYSQAVQKMKAALEALKRAIALEEV